MFPFVAFTITVSSVTLTARLIIWLYTMPYGAMLPPVFSVIANIVGFIALAIFSATSVYGIILAIKNLVAKKDGIKIIKKNFMLFTGSFFLSSTPSIIISVLITPPEASNIQIYSVATTIAMICTVIIYKAIKSAVN